MSNCKSGLTFGHVIVDISDPENSGDTHGALTDMLNIDGDLEGVEAMVSKIMKGKCIETKAVFESVFVEAFDILTNQEFYNHCDYSIIMLDSATAVSLSWIVGGRFSEDR